MVLVDELSQGRIYVIFFDRDVDLRFLFHVEKHFLEVVLVLLFVLDDGLQIPGKLFEVEVLGRNGVKVLRFELKLLGKVFLVLDCFEKFLVGKLSLGSNVLFDDKNLLEG